jgi:fructokinase
VTVVVAGEALIDLVVRADGAVHAIPGGGPYNAARTIARLGVACRFLGRLSTDRFGRALREALAADEVGLDLVETTDEPTTLALAELDADGAATYRFYLDGTSAPGLRGARLPAEATALHVGTLGLRLEPSGSTIEGLVGAAPDGVLVMLDVNARPSIPGDPGPWRERIRRIASRADVVKASRDDLAYLGEDPGGLLALGAGAVLVTDGPNPVAVRTERGRAEVEVPEVDVVDTVGAGDAFGGGFIAQWLGAGLRRTDTGHLEHLVRATEIGVRVAALTCARPGAAPPRRDEVPGFGAGVV